MSTLRELLLEAPDGQLDASMIPLIKGWMEPPFAIEVLEVLDKCVFGALASGLVMQVLQSLYDQALQRENKTHAEIEALADWRKIF